MVANGEGQNTVVGKFWEPTFRLQDPDEDLTGTGREESQFSGVVLRFYVLNDHFFLCILIRGMPTYDKNRGIIHVFGPFFGRHCDTIRVSRMGCLTQIEQRDWTDDSGNSRASRKEEPAEPERGHGGKVAEASMWFQCWTTSRHRCRPSKSRQVDWQLWTDRRS